MLTIKFNNESEFNKWVEERVADLPVIVEGGGKMETPEMYPCVMVYDWLENFYEECADEHEDFRALEEDGYFSDEIEMLKYHFVYPTDFD